jgi:hypothetical protein
MPTPAAALRAYSTCAARAAEESPYGGCTRYDPFPRDPSAPPAAPVGVTNGTLLKPWVLRWRTLTRSIARRILLLNIYVIVHRHTLHIL